MIAGVPQTPIAVSAVVASLMGAIAVLPTPNARPMPAERTALPEPPDLGWAVRPRIDAERLVTPPFQREDEPAAAPKPDRPAPGSARLRARQVELRGVFIAGTKRRALVVEPGAKGHRWVALGDRLGEAEVIAIEPEALTLERDTEHGVQRRTLPLMGQPTRPGDHP